MDKREWMRPELPRHSPIPDVRKQRRPHSLRRRCMNNIKHKHKEE
jgi:hypothetical protein